MKNQLTIDTKVMKEYGVMTAVVLAVINQSYEPLSVTETANMIGVSYPTAQKCLQVLVNSNLIKTDGKTFRKL